MNASEGVDRRRYARQRMASLAYVELGKDNGGIVLNVGEGGLAVAAAGPVVGAAVPQVRFRLPGSAKWIEAGVQIAWIGGSSKKEAGISFVNLPEADRVRIRDWISSPESATPASPAPKGPGRLRIVPSPEPAREPEPGTAVETVSPTPPSDPPSAGLPANSKTLPVEASAPASPKPGKSPLIPSLLGTAEVPKEDAEERAAEKRAAEERSIRVEFRVSRRLLTVAFVFLVALLSFLIGTVAGRHSWTDLLGRFKKAEGAIESSNRPEPAPVNPGSNSGVPSANSQQALAHTPQPSSPASDSLIANSTAPRSPAPRSGTEPAQQTSAGALNREPRGSAAAPIAPAGGLSRSGEPATAIPSPVRSEPAPSEQPSNQPPNERPIPSPSVTLAPPRTESQAVAPQIAAAPPPQVPAPAEPVATASPSSSPAAATPAAAVGTVAIVTNPYPSIRVPPSVQTSRSGTPLRLGLLTTRFEPVYPPEALHRGLQGVVQLHILIGTDGAVTDMEVVRGPQELIQAVRDAIGRWRYQPTLLGTEAVETEADVTVTFRLTTPPSK